MSDFQKPQAYKNTTTSQISKTHSNSDSSRSKTTVADGFFSHLGKALFGE